MTIDWHSPTEMARDLLAAKYLCILCLGAILVDFAHSISFDYRLLTARRKSTRIRWPQFCYFCCKVAYIPYWSVTFITGEASYRISCQTTIIISEFLMGFITCLCSGMLAFRTLCVWEQHSGVIFKSTLLFLWMCLFAVWMASVLDITGKWIIGIGQPWVADKGACFFDHIPFRYAIKFLVTVVFDAMVLILTVVGVAKNTYRTRIGAALVQQGIIYFALTVVVNIALIVFAWIDLNDVMTVILSVPVQTISVMAATRLYVMLFQQTVSGSKLPLSGLSTPSICRPTLPPTSSFPILMTAATSSSTSSSTSRNVRLRSDTDETLVDLATVHEHELSSIKVPPRPRFLRDSEPTISYPISAQVCHAMLHREGHVP